MNEEEMKAAKDKAESEAQDKKKNKGKGKLICVFAIKGEEKKYRPGDIYEGKNAKYLLSRGAIRKE